MEKGSAMIQKRSGPPVPTIDNAAVCVISAATTHNPSEASRPNGKCRMASAVTSPPVNTHGMTNIMLSAAAKKG